MLTSSRSCHKPSSPTPPTTPPHSAQELPYPPSSFLHHPRSSMYIPPYLFPPHEENKTMSSSSCETASPFFTDFYIYTSYPIISFPSLIFFFCSNKQHCEKIKEKDSNRVLWVDKKKNLRKGHRRHSLTECFGHLFSLCYTDGLCLVSIVCVLLTCSAHAVCVSGFFLASR